MKHHEFYTYIAQKMLDFVDTRVPDPSLPPVIVEESGRKGHYPVTPDKAKTPCIVCRMETNDGLGGRNKGGMQKIYNSVAYCKDCRMSAHFTVPGKKRKIHELSYFNNMSCWDVMHSKKGYQL